MARLLGERRKIGVELPPPTTVTYMSESKVPSDAAASLFSRLAWRCDLLAYRFATRGESAP